MAEDRCRPAQISVGGVPETIPVHGAGELDEEGREALGALVEATRSRMAEEGTSVRHATLWTLQEHWPRDGMCACGKLAWGAVSWSTHVRRALAEAGVLLPEDTRIERRP